MNRRGRRHSQVAADRPAEVHETAVYENVRAAVVWLMTPFPVLYQTVESAVLGELLPSAGSDPEAPGGAGDLDDCDSASSASKESPIEISAPNGVYVQRRASIFSRAALAKKAERVSPRRSDINPAFPL